MKGEQPHKGRNKLSGGAMTIALFGYPGVETVAVAAAKVRNPDRDIPRATVLGTIATAVVYMLSLTVVFGIVPTPQARQRDGTRPGGALGRAGT